MSMRDVRCNHETNLNRPGWVCGQLLFRASTDASGLVEIKCPRCSVLAEIALARSYDPTRR